MKEINGQLIEKIAAVARQVPEASLDSLIDLLNASGGELAAPDHRLLAAQIAQPSARALVADLLRCWVRVGTQVSPSALALALMSACYADRARRNAQHLELVWTGPSPIQSSMRRTDQVLLSLIDASVESLMIVTFAAYKIPDVCAGLLRAADRGVRVTLVLESAEVSAGKTAYEALAALGSTVAQSSDVYVWPLDKRPRDRDGHHGSLHVKCAIADDSVALISSANLTEFALNLNMELGTLIRGGDLPKEAASHLRSLIEDGTLVRVTRAC